MSCFSVHRLHTNVYRLVFQLAGSLGANASLRIKNIAMGFAVAVAVAWLFRALQSMIGMKGWEQEPSAHEQKR